MYLFTCVSCPERFTLEDVEEGKYFPSTGICLSCYRKMFKNKSSCFGKELLYDPHTLACSEECPDRKICRGFVTHLKEYMHKGE